MGWFVSEKKMKVVVQNTPKIFVKERLKKVEISGRSRMTDPGIFYEELQTTLETCFSSFQHTLILDFYFEYINTGSSKWLYHMLTHMQSLSDKGGLLEANWYYEEDDEIIQETGEVLESLLSFPFHLKVI